MLCVYTPLAAVPTRSVVPVGAVNQNNPWYWRSIQVVEDVPHDAVGLFRTRVLAKASAWNLIMIMMMMAMVGKGT